MSTSILGTWNVWCMVEHELIGGIFTQMWLIGVLPGDPREGAFCFSSYKCVAISRWWFQIYIFFNPCLGKIPILTNMFQRGWNHRPDIYIYINLDLYLKSKAQKNASFQTNSEMLGTWLIFGMWILAVVGAAFFGHWNCNVTWKSTPLDA